ncbi:uncharacterized protein LOC143854958 [Tasmannia lanceolata]|uniref:uncharacterized protein LOC143854958 n=1 Tax=Tasmannia lanceolata TaxID=3420 RepID=UPI004063E851
MYRLLQQPKSEISDFFIKETSSDNIPLEFLEEAVFAGDSFLSLEAAFGHCDGVVKTAVGFCGGTLKKPTSREVIEGGTGHTEAVKVTYDNRKICYKSLCNVFFESHDPTNKQYLGFGVETHYLSAIFYANEDRKKQARESKIKFQMKINRRMVTKIIPYASDFFLAENQHQKYYLQNKYIGLCESLNLRSTQQFVDSHIACKLNGILGHQEDMVAERLKKFMESCEFSKQTKLVLEGIIEDLERNLEGRNKITISVDNHEGERIYSNFTGKQLEEANQDYNFSSQNNSGN